MKFEGIYTPVITPYRDDFSIDYDRLAETVDFLIETGVHGIISAGTTGEYYAQSMQERFELMKFIKQQIKARTSYIVGTGAIRTEDSLEYARGAVEVGADAILVATPPYAIPTERENALHALAIDRVANLPILLYNFPDRMGAHMGEHRREHAGDRSGVGVGPEPTHLALVVDQRLDGEEDTVEEPDPELAETLVALPGGEFDNPEQRIVRREERQEAVGQGTSRALVVP